MAALPKRITLTILIVFSFYVSAQTEDLKGQRISAKKCQDYKEFYRETFAPRVSGRDPILGKNKCPSNRRVLQPNLRRDVFQHEFPHTASLWYETDVNGTVTGYKFRCSGVLISKRHVLTAAHCIYSKWGKPTHVTFGDSNLYKEQRNSKRQVIPVGDIIIHPHYVPPSSVGDIAIILLAKGVKYDTKSKSPRPSVRPACLPSENQEIIPSGVALSAYDISDGALRTERVELFETNKECEPFLRIAQKNNFTRRFGGDIIRPSQFCTHGVASSTCLTDIGGALTIQTMKSMPCVDTVIGILSVNGTSCSSGEANPIVFTKVENYLDWIEGVVWPKLFRGGVLQRKDSTLLQDSTVSQDSTDKSSAEN